MSSLDGFNTLRCSLQTMSIGYIDWKNQVCKLYTNHDFKVIVVHVCQEPLV